MTLIHSSVVVYNNLVLLNYYYLHIKLIMANGNTRIIKLHFYNVR